MRPGDTLCIGTTTTEARCSRSRLDRVIIKAFIEAINQDNAVVLDMKATNFIACRP
jgi:acyl dehydratase